MNISVSVNGTFHFFDLAHELVAQGEVVDMFTGYPRFKLRPGPLERERVHTFPWIHAPYMAFRSRDVLGARAVQAWEWLALSAFDRYVASHLPRELDVLIALTGAGLLSGRAAQARGARYICDRPAPHIRVQDRILREEHDRWGMPFIGIDPRVIETEEAEYETADAITLPSSFVQRSFLEQGVPAHKLHRIPFGVDLSTFRPTVAPDPTRFDVIFVAGPRLSKGLPYLLQAYRRLEHPRKSLTLVGPAPTAIIARMRQMGLWLDEVKVIGHLPHAKLKTAMSSSHVMALPSVQEGLALVQAQAMACGCPVIGTTSTGADDLFDDGVEGFIVPPRDSDALAARMQWMADHPEERAEMARLSLKRVQRAGGWRDYGAATIALCRKLVGSQPAPTAGHATGKVAFE